ncbi:MAG: oligosaccharide flippase family protein [Candidatus Azobacteroides pseudotrichonymphae]|jgi:O-antigen/teichoic acid export membrane protein|nr:MAG: oligosaccharide flippase family protein [Candidatus Azobacteroides pseudotrichonymphae]
MHGVRSLAKDSFIYGGSAIASKMMNWLLTVLFTHTLAKSDFGIMTNLYAYAALIIVVLTFGMETGFFRFANQTDKYLPATVYSTTLISVSIIVLVFLICFLSFFSFLRTYLWSSKIPGIYIRIVIVVLSMDAFSAIPFAYLRYKKRVLKFGILKLLNVVLYTFFCILFLVICPQINKHSPSLITWFWKDNFRLGYVFIANLLATFIEILCLLPELIGFKYRFDVSLAKGMFHYCFPLVIMGIAGVSNHVVDKLMFPAFYSGSLPMFDELGVYSACFKIALIMMMFTQAFRYAYEPFFFERSKEKDAKQLYADVMKYFVIFGLLVFLGVVLYLDIIKYLIAPEYFGALRIVPIVLWGELFFAVYFNLSVWYKLVDKTYWGAIFSTIAFVILIVVNIFFIPIYSYRACAWAGFTGDGFIMLLSYFIGQKYYPIRYDLKSIGFYTCLALGLYAVSYFVPIYNCWFHLAFNTILIIIYLIVVIKRDLLLKNISFVNYFV